ncbi:2-haloalkanoic acid dehalogenase [Lachnospiraceae bacterium KM106-2]|nr:2-haloalkanoic acid dehalogenase [Lachnospiraceae bacterium KM106-2]
MIKAFIFDLDDTLYDCIHVNNEAVSALCEYTAKELLHIKTSTVRVAFDRARMQIKEQLRDDVAAQHNRMLYIEKTLELLEIPPVKYALEMYDYFWNYVLEHMKLYEGAEDFLIMLKKKKIKIAICTDMTVHIQYRKLRALGIDSYIDSIITSEEVGREKPAPEMFQMALNKLNVLSSEAIYVGDNLKKDVIGPTKVGITAIWYHEEEQTPYLRAENYEKMFELFSKLNMENK